MKRYLVLTKIEGEITPCMKTGNQIIDLKGFQDCGDYEFEVFEPTDAEHFVHLSYNPPMKAPYNYHEFIRDDNGKIEIFGSSPEH